MDVTIPPHNLRRFSSSIACLGKIGKDLYLSFDPLDGLTLSSLNEAKSAYGRFHFDPQFFERCTAPPIVTNRGRNAGDDSDASDDEFFDTRYVCRVPVRSVHSVLHQRKGVVSLRIRSEGTDGEGNHFGLNRRRRDKGGRKRSRDRRERSNDDEEGEEGEERRGSFSARERRKRKRQKQSRRKKRTAEANDGEEGGDPDAISKNTDKMQLSFEFFIERPAPRSDPALPNPNASIPTGGVFRVLHKVGVTDAHGIALSASAAQRRTRSEIASPPKLWLRLLDPLRRTAEVALTIDDGLKVVTATSFHPGEVARGDGGADNAVLRAAAARNAVLRTETSTGVEEFDEYDFRNNRGKRRNGRDDDDGEGDGGSGNDAEEEEDDPEKESERPPADVNERVILVFGLKEAKAMLQYCAQTATSYDDEGVVLSFHWGGRPIVLETEGECFAGELVLATLHHGMIASSIAGGGVGG